MPSDTVATIDLGSLGAGNVYANGIYNSGQVVGFGYSTDFATTYAFFYSLAPVPEARICAMILIGLWVVGIAAKRNNAN